ncbi:hypothetical protein DICVIV_09421 [Dictyocaulus viviparus]|uniref:Proteasome component Ecm29 N-terminal domain-containing protein n=1 Tax=Dictyocaulus viviparus TaxID=29172 RepID=A0A0D8XQA5_DICVI|nr:hypothetical protein DICVIV_09421 [Dictyocaulus viviparus]
MEALSSSSPQNADISVSDSLERIYLRLAMIDSDEQLQKFTDIYLIRLIETANSNGKVFEKIKEILSHYNRRVKTNASIAFPVNDLLSMNLSLVYLRFAVANFCEKEHMDILPSLIDVISVKSSQWSQCAELLGLSVRAFMIIGQKERHTWPSFSLSADMQLVFIRFFHCIIAFHADQPNVVKNTCEALKRGENLLIPALTPEEYIMVAEKILVKVDSIVQLKLCILKVLVSGMFQHASVFSILVIASADDIDDQQCVEDRIIVDELMAIYLGHTTSTIRMIGKNSSVSPANYSMKQKILLYLTRSLVAPVAYMNNIKICLDGLGSTSKKLLIACLHFLVTVIEKMPVTAQKNFSSLLFERVKHVRDSAKDELAVSLAYRCMGILGKREPAIIVAQVNTIASAFSSIAQAPNDVSYAVVDCLTEWLYGVRKLNNPSFMKSLKDIIEEYISHVNLSLLSLKNHFGI